MTRVSLVLKASWATSLLVARRMAVILTMRMEVIVASMMVSLGGIRTLQLAIRQPPEYMSKGGLFLERG
jgi:hypothetical protein